LLTLVTISAMSVLGTISQGPDSATAATPQITWLAAGDSYASGAGLPHTSKLCARAVSPSEAWSTVAAGILRSEGLSVARPNLVACTGAVSGEFFVSHGPKNPAEYHRGGKRYDLVTFSFGGDDVGFSKIIEACLLEKAFISPCSDASVRASIATVAKVYRLFGSQRGETVARRSQLGLPA